MNDNENRVNVVIPENYNGTPIEVIIRQGEAAAMLDPKEPKIIEVRGTIESVFRWIEKRKELFGHKAANILVSREKIVLQLTINETDYYRSTIIGRLEVSKKFQEFGINSDKTWEPKKLSQFFKMNRAFFSDKTKNMELVSVLKNFKATITQFVEKLDEENGSRTDNFSQVVDSNLPKPFKLAIPLFIGYEAEEIEVEIYADVDGRNVTLSLVSPAAEELLEEYRNKVIDEQLAKIQDIAPDIVIIEQ
jgi:hypothetical protein